MKIPFFSTRGALATAVFCLAASMSFAQDTTPPVVATPINDFTVPAGSAPTVINLKKTFGLQGVTGKLVRFSTTLGNVDVELLADKAPQTVAAFLGYANAAGDNNSGVASYTNTLIQRVYSGFVTSTGGGTIVQGGGFYVDTTGRVDQITGRPSIPSEAGVKNTRGTLAMALSSGPDSANGDWFFNVGGDNPGLDDGTYGGPFTVFGLAVGDSATLNAIVALPQEDFTTQLGASFSNVPLVNYTSGQVGLENLVYLNNITALPLTPKVQGGTAALVLKVKGNSNPDLVTATVEARKLTLTYAAGQTGSATIKVMAKNAATKSKTFATFTVTVE